MIVALQAKRQATARELADQLGVSVRTVLRDIDALAEAEVPVVADRGRYGGISLLPGAEIDVNRLSRAEADVLALVGVDLERARQLGLESPAQRASQKLASRRPWPHSESEGPQLPLAEVVAVDSSDWFAPDESLDFAELVRHLRLGRRLRIEYRSSGRPASSEYVVDPYGLYSRGSRWYLIADVEDAPRMFAMSRLYGWHVLEEERRLRAGATLTGVAKKLVQNLEQRHDVVVTALLDAHAEDLARRILGSRLLSLTPSDEPNAVVITVGYEELGGVRQLMQFTDHIEIIEPPEARELARQLAQTMLKTHQSRR
ncbi:MAG: helix-turn-helix transcriptional regulator [Brevibacterium linens]